jgi:hypothetical protein
MRLYRTQGKDQSQTRGPEIIANSVAFVVKDQTTDLFVAVISFALATSQPVAKAWRSDCLALPA